MNDLKLRHVLVFLPNGKCVEIPAKRVAITLNEDGTIKHVDEQGDDKSVRRYVGFPVMLQTAPPNAVEVVGALPPELERGRH